MLLADIFLFMFYNVGMKSVIRYLLFILAILSFLAGEVGLGVSMLVITIVFTILTST